MVQLSPEQLEPDFVPPNDLESYYVQGVKARYSKWGWRLFWGFLLCLALTAMINVGFINWRKSINEEVITIHNIEAISSVELCPGETVRYQYNVASDMISPTVGVVIFSLRDTCPEEEEVK